MRRIAIAAALLLSLTVTGWSQAYYEASGQTAVFTLSAGAKSGPAAIHDDPVVRAEEKRGVTVSMVRGAVLITLPVHQRGNVAIALFDIAGRRIYQRTGDSEKMLRLETRSFAPGVYSLLVRVDGMTCSRCIAVGR
jgi:hypothetical protein